MNNIQLMYFNIIQIIMFTIRFKYSIQIYFKFNTCQIMENYCKTHWLLLKKI